MSHYDFSDSQEAGGDYYARLQACRDEKVEELSAAIQIIDRAPLNTYTFDQAVLTDQDRRELNEARDKIAEIRKRVRMRR